MGDIGWAVVGEDAFYFDAMEGIEGEGLAQGSEDGVDFFVLENAGVAESGVVIDGHMKGFVACALTTIGSVAGGAYSRFVEACELLHVEVKEIAWVFALVADRWRFWSTKKGEFIESVALEDAIDGGAREWDEHSDLGVAHAESS